jgi:hypothetical protein
MRGTGRRSSPSAWALARPCPSRPRARGRDNARNRRPISPTSSPNRSAGWSSVGDCREWLRQIPTAVIHLCVTSPPLFRLAPVRRAPASVWGGVPRLRPRMGRGDGRAQAVPRATCRNGADGFLLPALRSMARTLGLEPSVTESSPTWWRRCARVRRVLRDEGFFS